MRRAFTNSCSHRIARQVLRRHFTVLAETGVRVLYCLGCGVNGCAFRAQDWTVLKISAQPDEAPLARVLNIGARAWPFLPIFYGGWELPGRDFGQRHNVGVSWREDLVDFEPARRERDSYVAAATDLVDLLKKTRTSAGVARACKKIVARCSDFSSKSLMALESIAGIAEWSLRFGLGFRLDEFAGDLAIRNLGQSLERDDAIVIRDLGYWNNDESALDRLERAVRGGQ